MQKPVYIAVSALLLSACYTRSPHIQINNNFNLADSTISMAVLDLEYSGSFISLKLADNIANNITSELYITKNIQIVDRSLVKESIKKFDKNKKNKYSREDIKNIGNDLQANYIVLGSVASLGSIEDYYESRKRKLEITLRIIETASGDVVGIIRHSKSGELDLDELAKLAVKEMIRFL